MIICEYKNTRITLESLSKYLVDNKYLEHYIDVVLLYKDPLRIFLKRCLENDYIIESIEILKRENKDKYFFGFKFKNVDSVTLLEKYKYLQEEDSFIFFLDNYHYSKELYPDNIPPYIKKSKLVDEVV